MSHATRVPLLLLGLTALHCGDATSDTPTIGGAGVGAAAPSMGGSAGVAGLSLGGNAGVDGGSGTAGTASGGAPCTESPTDEMCNEETQGAVCSYFDANGCPRKVRCGGAEGGVIVWLSFELAKPGMECLTPGAECPYEYQPFVFNTFYIDLVCGDSSILEHDSCPTTPPTAGDPCEAPPPRITNGSLSCEYEVCEAPDLVRVGAGCQCAGTDPSCMFGPVGRTVVGSCG